MPTPIPIQAFAQAQTELLLAEHEAEIASSPLSASIAQSDGISASTRRTLQAAGYALIGLVLINCRTGMGGREVGEFGVDSAIGFGARGGKDSNGDGGNGDGGAQRLGAHGMRVGDVVRVEDVAAGTRGGGGRARGSKEEERKEKALEGVVTRVGERSIWVAFGGQRVAGGKGRNEESVEDLWGKKVWMMKQTMAKLGSMTESDYTYFMRVVFGHSTPSPVDLSSIGTIEFIDPTLNDSQREAIRFALAAKEIALIHGPPGTGKTYTLIELILQFLRQNLRILVCGPSNVSVDNIVERLAPHKVPLVRIGHPARLLSTVLDHSLEVLIQTSDAAAIVKDIRKEIEVKQASIRKTRSGRERREIYRDLKELRKEFRERESKCVGNLVTDCKVVLATLHGAGGHQLRNQKFDVVIIDEASQALEAQCWVPLLSASKAILAGDHLQLPPTVKSATLKFSGAVGNGKSPDDEQSVLRMDKDNNVGQHKAKGGTLEMTLFDRLLSLHGPAIKRMLTTQYRMHEKIMQFPSQELYESKLIAADAVKLRLLKDLPYEVEETDDTREPLGGDFPEKVEEPAVMPKAEADIPLCREHVENLIGAGVKPEDVAVVTPYNAQLALLSSMLKDKYPGLELESVDGFQGREKEAVIVSLVRSNPEHEVGFLAEKRRLNASVMKVSISSHQDIEPSVLLATYVDIVLTHGLSFSGPLINSGNQFLRRWMDFLEENADLRYPDAGEYMQS
ncbi:insulin II gene enhancer-binding protein rip1 [Histoplasma capsulatum H143]|uniref:Insulin II gene enhancer-binding protein rip1 n=1 Tax=Ajellomyces capsulatus (strain H143) TaxID=544712 RepID=C6H3G7_AJECH|nr:insulin II gene enhancer-binding protein rip1 [Histoplasma capsulatum H143]